MALRWPAAFRGKTPSQHVCFPAGCHIILSRYEHRDRQPSQKPQTHGIPIPGWAGRTARSVEGIWQGLKVFESEDVDLTKFEIVTMRGIKRSVRPRGRVRGHRFGAADGELLDYLEARRRIYLPAYRWVLENRLQAEVETLRRHLRSGPVVLLDYETNTDLEDLRRPLSHASLVRHFVEGSW